MTRVEQTAVAITGMQDMRRVHEHLFLAPMRRNCKSLLEEAAHRRRAGAA
jgi:hypothetical protein